MAPSERRALLLLLSLAVAGHLVRRVVTAPGDPPGQVELLSTLASASSPAAHRDSAMRVARPLDPGERIDLDRASAQEIARLPRVGLTLARTIVADRETNGAFGNLAGLDRVSGVGPGLLKAFAEHARFSGISRPSQENRGFAGVVPATPNSGIGAEIRTRIDLNIASASDLDALPGVGPARAQAIVRHRDIHGPFLSVDGLARVPGIGPAALTRLRPLVVVH